ncbi:MAG: hypothetical protein H8E55_46845 [Pelagibacterales bacterium]|nr:hypothetical protein [Pelagibacterales bacterium]
MKPKYTLNEGQPIFQDTPNEFAYLEFKKWAHKNRKKIKKQLLAAASKGDAGTKLFIELANIWGKDWSSKYAKEWSRIPSTPAEKKDFGRALAVMMKKDNLIISKAGNKLTTVESKITEAYPQKVELSLIDDMKEGDKFHKIALDMAMDINDELENISQMLNALKATASTAVEKYKGLTNIEKQAKALGINVNDIPGYTRSIVHQKYVIYVEKNVAKSLAAIKGVRL